MECAAPTGTQPCTDFRYKDFCGSTVLGTPELVGLNGQIDWQAQQISHLVCNLGRAEVLRGMRNFLNMDRLSITALIA